MDTITTPDHIIHPITDNLEREYKPVEMLPDRLPGAYFVRGGVFERPDGIIDTLLVRGKELFVTNGDEYAPLGTLPSPALSAVAGSDGWTVMTETGPVELRCTKGVWGFVGNPEADSDNSYTIDTPQSHRTEMPDDIDITSPGLDPEYVRHIFLLSLFLRNEENFTSSNPSDSRPKLSPRRRRGCRKKYAVRTKALSTPPLVVAMDGAYIPLRTPAPPLDPDPPP